MDKQALIEAWRQTISGDNNKSWVLFENGTCVVLMEPGQDLVAQSTALLSEWGPVGPGSSFGDFGTVILENGIGYVVTCHHNDILTFVAADELGPEADDALIGLTGRSKRGQDAGDLQVIHVEDKRA